jgi:hypothetical protein
MARNRMIKATFWEDNKLAEVSAFARLLFISLWNFADDEGYVEHNPKWLKIKCFPYDDININELLKELFKIEVITENNSIIWIKNFSKHQTLTKKVPSKLKDLFLTETKTVKSKINRLKPKLTETEKVSPKEKEKEKKKVKENEKEEEENIPAVFDKTAQFSADNPPLDVKTDGESPPEMLYKHRRPPANPQQMLFEYMRRIYEKTTSLPFNETKQAFTLLSRLVKQHGEEAVRQKINIFYVGCKNAVFWFARDSGMANFTVEKLTKFWNEIIPQETEEQRRKRIEHEKSVEFEKQLAEKETAKERENATD